MLRITDDATPADMREAVAHLRAKQLRVRDEQVRADLSDDIDDLVAAVVAAERRALPAGSA